MKFDKLKLNSEFSRRKVDWWPKMPNSPKRGSPTIFHKEGAGNIERILGGGTCELQTDYSDNYKIRV